MIRVVPQTFINPENYGLLHSGVKNAVYWTVFSDSTFTQPWIRIILFLSIPIFQSLDRIS